MAAIRQVYKDESLRQAVLKFQMNLMNTKFQKKNLKATNLIKKDRIKRK